MTLTREIPYPRHCGCDDVVIRQELRGEVWVDIGIRKLSNTTMISDLETTPGLTGSANSHARLSPSDAKRWSSCLASIAFQEANAHRVRDDSTSYADFGTECHEIAAKVLLKQMSLDDVEDPYREVVVPYVQHCLASIPEGSSYDVEVQADLFYQPEQKGTCDFAWISDDLVVIKDLKAGAGVLVKSEANVQLSIYAYSFIKMFEGIYSFHPGTVVSIHAFQPRHREGADQTPWEITLADLAKFCETVEYAAIRAREGANRVREKIGSPGRDVSPEEILEAAPGLVFAPEEGDGGSCRFCRCRAFCPKRLEAATEGMDLPTMNPTELLAAMPDLDKDEKKQSVEERLATVTGKLGLDVLPDSYLVTLLARKKAITSFLNDVDEYLEGRLLDGQEIPGVKLVEGREGNREWANEAEADAWLKNQGLKQDDRYDFKLKGPAKIEVLLKDKLKTVTRTKNRFSELITRSPAKRTIALADDKREAVKATVAAMPDLEPEPEDEFAV